MNGALEESMRMIAFQLQSIQEPKITENIRDIKHWYLSEFLSESARRDRRNAMFFSIIVIIYFPLGITVDQIGPGIRITGSQDLIPLLLCCVAGYFTCVFLIKVISTIKGEWVACVVTGYLEKYKEAIDVYEVETGGDMFKQKLKNLQENKLSMAYGQLNLYDVISFFPKNKEILNGYFFSDYEFSRKIEFEHEEKSRGHGKPDGDFFHLFWPIIWRKFYRPANLLELLLPWGLFLFALYSYLSS